MSDSPKSKIIDLNVGGRHYATTIGTLMQDPSSLLTQFFTGTSDILSATPSLAQRSRSPTPTAPRGKSVSPGRHADTVVIQHRSDGTYFIDRDGDLFRYILDYLRTAKITLPENFTEINRLREEAKFFRLNELMKQLKVPGSNLYGQSRRGTLPALVNGLPVPQTMPPGARSPGAGHRLSVVDTARWGYITVGYRGTFAFGRDGQADVKFRKLSRILVCGRSALCREIFGDSLNESRDPDRVGENRYTSRLFLKHSFLEQAFDRLADCGFTLVASCASGTCASGDLMRGSAADCEEQKWNHYNEFVFYRPRAGSVASISSM